MGTRHDDDEVTHDLLTAAIAAAVTPLATEQRWLKWGMFVIGAAVFSPKLGGPPPSQVAALVGAITSDPHVGPFLVAARSYIGL